MGNGEPGPSGLKGTTSACRGGPIAVVKENGAGERVINNDWGGRRLLKGNQRQLQTRPMAAAEVGGSGSRCRGTLGTNGGWRGRLTAAAHGN